MILAKLCSGTRDEIILLLGKFEFGSVADDYWCTKDIERKKMANVGIEPKTFALLARRSNQLR